MWIVVGSEACLCKTVVDYFWDYCGLYNDEISLTLGICYLFILQKEYFSFHRDITFQALPVYNL